MSASFFDTPRRAPQSIHDLPPVEEQLWLCFEVPAKATVTNAEAAALLNMSIRQVELMVTDKTLLAIDISRRSPNDPQRQRGHRRILVRRKGERPADLPNGKYLTLEEFLKERTQA